MSDRTSAELFASILRLIADNPTLCGRKLAYKVWSMTGGYDFHPCQMSCDETLLKLGLAVETTDPDEGEGFYNYASYNIGEETKDTEINDFDRIADGYAGEDDD